MSLQQTATELIATYDSRDKHLATQLAAISQALAKLADVTSKLAEVLQPDE
jgi:ABC-type transporter Mla subunit MlaD